MSADVSRALARFVASLNLSREAARELVAQYGDVQAVTDLPDWIREAGD